MIRKRNLVYGSMLAAGLALPTGAWAQGAMLEEVLVTAQKRVESLQEVPVAVTAIGGDAVREGSVVSLQDVSVKTPGLTMTQFNVGEPQIYLRGIGNTNDSAGADPAVAVFIDEVYIGRAGGAAFDLYDMERVEVLRGPQGTLFGKNVIGGAISIITKKPSSDFEGKVGMTVGNYDLRSVRGYINGPLTDNLFGKVSLSKRDRDGFSEDVALDRETQDEDNFSGRIQTLWLPTDSTEVLLGFDAANDTNNGNCRVPGNFDKDSRTALAPLYQSVVNQVTGGDVRKCGNTTETYQQRQIRGLLAKVSTEFESFDFNSITAWRSSDYKWGDNLGGMPWGMLAFDLFDSAEEEADQVSQEFRFSGSAGDNIEWLAGYFFMRENVERSERFVSQFNAPLASAPLVDPDGVPNSGDEIPYSVLNGDVEFLQDVTTTSHALFGQAKWQITEDLGLRVGARYSYDKKEADQTLVDHEGTGFSGVPANGGPPYDISAEESWSEFTPSISLDYHITYDSFVYATVSKGYKSGAYASTADTAVVAETPLEPETVWNYEVGAKTEWFDKRLRINLALFYMDYEDLQIFSLGDDVRLKSGNGTATSQGAEIEISAALTENLRLNLTYAYLDTEYEDYQIDTKDFAGNVLPRSPEHSYNIDLSYRVPFANGSDLTLMTSYAYKDDYFFDPANYAVNMQEGYGLWDASATWRSPEDLWKVTVWGKNLEDEEYRQHSIRSNIVGYTAVFAPPRTYGLTVERSFY